MKPVAQYNPDTGEKIAEFDSIAKAAASITGAYSANISTCCKGNAPTAYGYVWRYRKKPKKEDGYGDKETI